MIKSPNITEENGDRLALVSKLLSVQFPQLVSIMDSVGLLLTMGTDKKGRTEVAVQYRTLHATQKYGEKTIWQKADAYRKLADSPEVSSVVTTLFSLPYDLALPPDKAATKYLSQVMIHVQSCDYDFFEGHEPKVSVYPHGHTATNLTGE